MVDVNIPFKKQTNFLSGVFIFAKNIFNEHDEIFHDRFLRKNPTKKGKNIYCHARACVV